MLAARSWMLRPWPIALLLLIVAVAPLATARDASAQVFRPRGQKAGTKGKKGVAPVVAAPKAPAPAATRRAPASQARAPEGRPSDLTPTPRKAKRPTAKRARSSDDEVVVDDDDDVSVDDDE